MSRIHSRALVCACTLLLIAAASAAASQPPGPGAPTVDISANPGKALHRSACVTAGAGPAGAFQCGELLMAHSMPAYRTLNRDRTLTLLYNSGTARSTSIVMADVSFGSSVSVPDRIDVALDVDHTSYATFQEALYSFSSAGFTSGGPSRRLAVGFDSYAAGLTTGAYPYRLHVTSVYGTQTYTTTVSGTLIVVDQRSSPYGAGWGVAGVERIHFQASGNMLFVGGDGSALLYEFIGNNQWLAPAGAYRDTVTWSTVSDGSVPQTTYYWRRDLDGTRTFFNAAGLQKYVVDRVGQKVEYIYQDETQPQSVLTYIQIAPHSLNKRYAFAWDANLMLDSLSDPAGRALILNVDSAADGTHRVLEIRDPGLSAGSEVKFEYDSAKRMTRRRSQRGYYTAYRYHDAEFGATGLLRSDSLPVSTTLNSTAFTPVQVQGLVASSATNYTVASSDAYVLIDGPRTDVADKTWFFVNGDNAPTKVIDALSNVTSIERTNTTFPLLPTRVVAPNNAHKKITYDSKGNVSEVRDSTSHLSNGMPTTVTEYTYGSD
jgi:hypothetical protein